LGSIKATEHRIELKPGSKPVRLNLYRMGPRTRELIMAQVDRMLKCWTVMLVAGSTGGSRMDDGR